MTRHIGKLGNEGAAFTTRAAETIGYIIFRTGNGDFTIGTEGFQFSGGISSDSVRATTNRPPYTSSTGVTLQGAVATQQGEDGGDGSYAALYGTTPFNGSNIDLVIDESSNADRNHTTERVAWFGFRSLSVPIDVQKAVDIADTSGFQTITYTMKIKNTGLLPLLDSEIVVSDVLTQGTSVLTLTSPVTRTPAVAVSLAAGDTWTYTAEFQIREVNYDASDLSLFNTFTATANAYGLITTKSSAATTLLSIVPRLDVVKTAVVQGTNAIPAGGVSLGDVVEYTYAVRNNGNVAMNNVKLADDHLGQGAVNLTFGSCQILPGDDNVTSGNTSVGTTDFQITTLAPRDIVTCTATYTVTQDNIDNLQNQ